MVYKHGVSGNVRHSYMWGRDRIIKKVYEHAKRKKDEVFVAVIDYERGVAREYINRNFRLQKLEGFQGLLVGISYRQANVLAIVFDPDIENVLERVLGTKQLSVSQREKLKSNKACEELKKIFENNNVKKMLQSLAKKLLELLGRNI